MKDDLSRFSNEKLLERYRLQTKIIKLLKAAHDALERENYSTSFLHLFTAQRYVRKMVANNLLLPEEEHIPTLINEQLLSIVNARLLQN